MSRKRLVFAAIGLAAAVVVASIVFIVGPGLRSEASVDVNAVSGGTVTLGSDVVLRIPPGALASDTTVKVSRAQDANLGALDAAIPIGGAFLISSGGSRLSAPVTLEVAFDPARLPSGAALEAVFLARYDEPTHSWLPVYGEANLQRHVIVVQTDHLSWWQPWTWDLPALVAKVWRTFEAVLAFDFLPSGEDPNCVPPANYVSIRANELIKACALATTEAGQIQLMLRSRRSYPVVLHAPAGVVPVPFRPPGLWGQLEEVLLSRGVPTVYLPPAGSAQATIRLGATRDFRFWSAPAYDTWAVHLVLTSVTAILLAIGVKLAAGVAAVPGALKAVEAIAFDLAAVNCIVSIFQVSYAVLSPATGELLKLAKPCIGLAIPSLIGSALGPAVGPKVAPTVSRLVGLILDLMETVPATSSLLVSQLTLQNLVGEVFVSNLLVMDDTFDDNVLDTSRWTVSVPPGSGGAVVASQRLELSLGPGPGGPAVRTNCALQGDFDVQVDYLLMSWPAPGLNRYGVRLTATDFTPNAAAGEVGTLRGFASSRDVREPTFEVYGLVARDQVAVTPTQDVSGTLRLVRSGSSLLGFFLRGNNWVRIGSGAADDFATHIHLAIGNSAAGAPGNVRVAFDNFKVNAGTVSCSATRAQGAPTPIPATPLPAPTGTRAPVSPTPVPLTSASPASSPTAVPGPDAPTCDATVDFAQLPYSLRGRITGRAGAGIAGVRVIAYRSVPQVPGCWVPALRTQTDPSGNFSLPISGGTYRVWFAPPAGSGYSGQWWQNSPAFSSATSIPLSGNVSGIDAVLSGP